MSGPSYTYTAVTPNVADAMNTTTTTIRSNFQAINELVAVNHVTFNSSDVGKHNFVSLEFQDPVPAVQSQQLTMYCAATGSPNPAEIFYTYPSSLTTNNLVEQLTDQTVPSTGTGTSFGNSSQGYCTFPSGVKIRWGQQKTTNDSGGAGPFSFTSGTPAYTTYLQCSATSPTTTGTTSPLGIQLNGFINPTNFYAANYGNDPASTSTTVTFNYLMMGV
ncbi:hypothetical protein UFOVP9_10 [uncultured Caudovirales phage]|jgi:hypothetical protein|uniref:Uncharacterized protein n=1 Tax=uncultured Caudovirales phage TaxID=2100421 RepID=A0A6J5KGM1_9CAUD|nr:hypothetical protein UFOVP9_10 [uncultured Caudovirales phage]